MKKIVLLYTGGTIGMTMNKETGFLEPHSLESLLEKVPQMGKFKAQIDFYSFPKIKDSADISLEDWQSIGSYIWEHYTLYDGFVILHGTDTMSYTASALSFMFQNLDKPILVTGAAYPIENTISDAVNNLLFALKVCLLCRKDAVNPLLTEVGIVFNNKVFRANRTVKLNSTGFDLYASPNFPVLLSLETLTNFDVNLFLRPNLNRPVRFLPKLSNQCLVLNLFPGITKEFVVQYLNALPFKVLIVGAYGSGTIISAPWFTDCLKNVISHDKHVVMYSQCVFGKIEPIYFSSKIWQDIGVISVNDMTFEALWVKVLFILGQSEDNEYFKKNIRVSLCGEIT